MKVSELKTEMDGKFAAVDKRFERVDDEFKELRRLIKTEGDANRRYVDDQIKAEGETTRRYVDDQIKAEGETTRRYVDDQIKAEGETTRRHVDDQIKAEGETTRRYVDDQIKAEGETTRRHFDVVAEKVTSERNLALDRSMATAQQLVALTASNAGDHVTFERRLDDHDRRLEKIEQANDTEPEGR